MPPPENMATARALYNESRRITRRPEEEDLIWELYGGPVQKSFTEETPIDWETAQRAHAQLAQCVRGFGFWRAYDPTCLERQLATTIQATGDANAMARYARERRVRLLGYGTYERLWQAFEKAPLLRHVLLEFDQTLVPFQRYLALTEQAIRRGVIGQKEMDDHVRELLGQFDSMYEVAPYTGRVSGTPPALADQPPLTALLVQHMAVNLRLACDFAEYRLEYHAQVQRRPAQYADLADLEVLLASDNAIAQATAIPLWAEQQWDPQPLMALLRTARDEPVVDAAIQALASYPRDDVMDFLFRELRLGPFAMQLKLRTVLARSPEVERVRVRAEALSQSTDSFERLVGADLVQQMAAYAPLRAEAQRLAAETGQEIAIMEKGITRDRFTTAFFRFPEQLAWLSDELQQLLPAPHRTPPVTITAIGSSYGPEVYSIVMDLDQRFARDPEAWHGVHPLSQLRLIATDIDPIAVAYAQRGRFTDHPCHVYSDTKALEIYAQERSLDLTRYFDKPNGDTYVVKPFWRQHITMALLDITNPEPYLQQYGRPDGLLYNMVDGHLPDTPARLFAATRVAQLPTRFAIVGARYEVTTEVLDAQLDVIQRAEPSTLYRGKTTLRE